MPPKPVFILVFDTAAAHCAAAVLCGAQLLCQRIEPMKTGQAERLLPLLEELLAGEGLVWADLSALGVGIGPGNFTGLRLGVSAARGLALALGIPAIGITALEMRAPATGKATVTLPAGRGHAYRQQFKNGIATDAPEVIAATTPPEAAAPDLHRMGLLTLARMSTPGAAPAPLYLRAADAAPGADSPPILLDAG
ncbi:MAG: tRNA (adenosine(37)-N6)-threonylcarbamoyltransferase complex dimerization subunit type 1 TsaB [Paracoccaceae bacterium]